MFKFLMNETSRFCMEEVAGGAGGGAGGGATAAAPAVAWAPKATPEDVAYIKAKGWDKTEAPAETILKSYQHLEKLNGAVAGGKAIIPPEEGASQEQLDAYYNKLGRPETIEGYEIKEPWAGMDDTVGKELTALAHKTGMTKAQVAELHKWNAETAAKMSQTFEANYKIENAQQVEKLTKEWGAAYDQNLQVATEAAKAFGITPEQITNLQVVMGYDGVMKFMHNIGAGLGESKFVSTGGTGGRTGADNVMTPAQAQAELSRLGTDPAFTKAWMDNKDLGHKAAVDKKTQLTKWAYPQG